MARASGLAALAGGGMSLVMPSRAERPALAAAIRALAPTDPALPDRAALETWARTALARSGLGEAHLGYAMVLASNAWWTPHFAGVPPTRRLLLLPHCLRSSTGCTAPTDAGGLHCRRCGGCDLAGLSAEAEALGWRVIVAEGVAAVLDELVGQGRDAILGVACLDSLERSFARVRDLGLPHLAVPLDADGCLDTTVDGAALRALLHLQAAPGATAWRSWLPLLRAANRLFEPAVLHRLLGVEVDGDAVAEAALAWLGGGGRRLRAFIVLAAYAVGRHGAAALHHGAAALHPDADPDHLLPEAAQRLALAIEVLHKASLVHDDIEDDEALRYGRPTVQAAHGVAAAINIGDWLVGLGYRLACAGGGTATADIVSDLAAAQLALCRGQGEELRRRASGGTTTAIEVLRIAADKTAPAFAAALSTGLRAAGAAVDPVAIDRFARCLGEAYQVRDDLDDDGGDLRTGQPTILRALALEQVPAASLAPLPGEDPASLGRRITAIYRDCGARDRAERLAGRLRQRALDAAADLREPELVELGGFLVRTILAPRDA